MGKTHAPSGAILGILLGIFIYAKTNAVLGIIAMIVFGVIGWFVMIAIENALYKLGEKAEDAVKRKIDEKRNGK